MVSRNIEKVVYFVRHGQSVANITDVLQGLDDVLSPKGEVQAEMIAARATGLDFELIISSDAVRAMKTAETISKRTGKEITTSSLFRELKRPTSFVGQSRTTPEFQKFDSTWREHFDDTWKYEDGETLREFIDRTMNALIFLEQRPESKILVVTHGYFLRSLVVYILHRKQIVPETYFVALDALLGENTGLTTCFKEDGRWRLLTWNDHAHLG